MIGPETTNAVNTNSARTVSSTTDFINTDQRYQKYGIRSTRSSNHTFHKVESYDRSKRRFTKLKTLLIRMIIQSTDTLLTFFQHLLWYCLYETIDTLRIDNIRMIGPNSTCTFVLKGIVSGTSADSSHRCALFASRKNAATKHTDSKPIAFLSHICNNFLLMS